MREDDDSSHAALAVAEEAPALLVNVLLPAAQDADPELYLFPLLSTELLAL